VSLVALLAAPPRPPPGQRLVAPRWRRQGCLLRSARTCPAHARRQA